MNIIKRLPGIAAVLVAAALPLLADGVKSPDARNSRSIETLAGVVRELELNYVDTVDPSKLITRAINGMLGSLDPYTEFYTQEDRENFEKLTTGDYAGIGSYITERDGGTYISGPFEGSPAAKAGLLPGDHIVFVDTVDVRKFSSSEVSSKLRGKPGTTVRVTVHRPFVGADSVKIFDITREKLHTPSVPYYTVLPDKNIGYIRLTQFIEKSPDEVREALESFKKAGVQGVVFDLRSNGGGLLEGAVDILGNFLPKGTEVLTTRGRDFQRTYKTVQSPLFPDLPLAVLIDDGTASASEIMAGALQDLDRAVLVGERSFGKGLVQGSRELPNNNLLKITTAKYYIPSGRLIQALDYSHRNPDGSVMRTPDSLTNLFHTAKGREVRDGGGLKPDVEVKAPFMKRLHYNLIRDFWIFDYANRFVASNPQIGPAEDFVVTDEMYDDFKKGIDPDRFKYDKVCAEGLKMLREAAENEGYMDEKTTEQFDKLAAMLTHDLQKDLDLQRKEVSQSLAEEIVSRYYYDRGRIIQEIKDDLDLDKAVEILSDKEAYNKLLAAPAKKPAKKKK